MDNCTDKTPSLVSQLLKYYLVWLNALIFQVGNYRELRSFVCEFLPAMEAL